MTKARKLADLIDANGDVAVANLDNVTADAISSGTLSSDRLPTVPITKGGTGSTTLGTAGQYLKVNSGATGVEYATLTVPTPDWNTLANKPTNVSTFTNNAGYATSASKGTFGDGASNFINSYTQFGKTGTNIYFNVGTNCNCNG